jgi:hypothetical protein
MLGIAAEALRENFHFTCFTGTKVQILTLPPVAMLGIAAEALRENFQFTCFTGTKYKY